RALRALIGGELLPPRFLTLLSFTWRALHMRQLTTRMRSPSEQFRPLVRDLPFTRRVRSFRTLYSQGAQGSRVTLSGPRRRPGGAPLGAHEISGTQKLANTSHR